MNCSYANIYAQRSPIDDGRFAGHQHGNKKMIRSLFSNVLPSISYRWLAGLVVVIFAANPSPSACQLQQPTPHLKFENNQFRPIPRSVNDNPLDVETNSKTERLTIDKLVRPVNYESTSVPGRVADAELPWTYELKNIGFQQFASRLDDIWGERIKFEFLDDEQRTLRIYLPAGKTAPEASVKCDRVTGRLIYEGAANRKKAWHVMMGFIDRAESSTEKNKVSLIDVGMLDESMVRLVSGEFQEQDEDSVEINLNDVTTEDLEKLLRLEDIQGKVRLTPVPEQNLLIVDGDPDGVETVKKFLEGLNKTASTMGASARNYPLLYNDPNEVLENIQNLYQAQFEAINGPINIIAAPGGLLAAGPAGGLDALQRIVDGLEGIKKSKVPDDTTGPTQKELTEREKGYRTFVLRFIDAGLAERQVRTLAGQNQNLNVAQQNRQAEAVDTQVDPLLNTLIVYARPEFLRRAEALIKELDKPSDPNQLARLWRIFPIRNHRAGDFAVLLQDSLTQGLQGNQGLNETQNNQLQQNGQIVNEQFQQNNQTNRPFTAFTPLRIQLNGVPSAPVNFFHVRITSDAPSNTIQVVATEEAMALIEQIIPQLDRLPDLSSEVKVFPVINGDAQEILDTLEQIFGAQQGAAGGGAGQTASLQDLPLQSPGSDGQSLINIRFAINQRTNTIIASGSQGDLEFVEALIYRLDEADIQDRQWNIYRLSNASVLDVSSAINDALTEFETLVGNNPQTNNGIGVARRDVIVVEEETSNQLIVNARPEQMAIIDRLVNTLDRRPPMVKVKAMIVQVNLDQLENYGVEFGIQDSSIFDAGLNDGIGTGFVGLDNPAGQLVSDLGVGRASAAAGGISGLLLSAGDESLNFVLRFLKQKGCASILFSPHLMTMENLEGRFNQGSQVQRSTGISNQGLGVVQNFEDVEVGITLAITPRVSPDGMIVMFVDVENSSVGPLADGTPVGVDANGNAVISPPINQTVAQTTVMARSGQTVVLSGLIQESKETSITSVPILGDLPVIGPIFQSVENTADRQEILIILTPYVVDGEDDLSALNQDDYDRMHWCRADVAEIYGNTSYTGLPYRENYPQIFYPDVDPRGENPEFQGVDEGPITEVGKGQESFDNVETIPSGDRWRNRDEGSGSRLPPVQFEGSESRNELPPQSSYRRRHGERSNFSDFVDQRNVGAANGRRDSSIEPGERFANRQFDEREIRSDNSYRGHAMSESWQNDRGGKPMRPIYDERDYSDRPEPQSRLEIRNNGRKYRLH